MAAPEIATATITRLVETDLLKDHNGVVNAWAIMARDAWDVVTEIGTVKMTCLLINVIGYTTLEQTGAVLQTVLAVHIDKLFEIVDAQTLQTIA